MSGKIKSIVNFSKKRVCNNSFILKCCGFNTLQGYICLLCIVVLLCGFRWSLSFGELTWEKVNAAIKADYPGVAHIDTSDLQKLIRERRGLVLIDVRESEEYQISHIPGAVHVSSFNTIARNNTDSAVLIVAYCSVGLRSAKFISELQKSGFINAYNLRGSVFEWANQHMELIGAGGRTRKVHPYNTRWGSLLNTELHQYP